MTPPLRLLLALLIVAPASAQDRSEDYTEPHQRQALELYRTLVETRTAAGHGQVPAAMEMLADRFREAGFPEADVHVLPAVARNGEDVASLVVRYRGDGSSGEAPVLFLAHADVVDALESDWERDPFTLIEEDGLFYGRGTADDKYGVALLTTAFLRLRAEEVVPRRDLILAFTGDEETGMATTRSLAGEHRALIDAAFALNADAGGGQLRDDGTAESYAVQTGEKTYVTFELSVTNPGGHSSTPRTDNAIYQLMAALDRLEDHRFPVQTNETTQTFLQTVGAMRGGVVGEAMQALAEDPEDEAAARVLWHEPGLVGTTRTTCIPTMLRAGHAENALPQSAVATVNCRLFPGTEVAAVEAVLREIVADPEVQFTVLGDPVESPVSPLRDDALAAIRAGVDRLYPGTPVIPQQSSGGTDGMHLRRAGIPTYGTNGVFARDDERGGYHGLDEHLGVRAFFDALEFWDAVLREVAGSATRG